MASLKKTVVEVEKDDGTLTTTELLEAHDSFCILYVNYGLNGTRAYLDVYNPTASEDERRKKYPGAAVSSHNLLKNPNIKDRIRFLKNQKIKSKDDVLLGLSEISDSSVRPFLNYGSDQSQFPFFDLQSEEAKASLHLVKDIKIKRSRRWEGKGEDAEEWEDEEVELKMYNRHEALKDMGRFHKLFVDRVEHSGVIVDIPWEDLTQQQLARIQAGEDPLTIKKEIDDAKNKNTNK